MKAFTTAGCACALLALLFFPAFGVVTMICGVLLFARGRISLGIAIIVIGATSGYLGVALDLPYGDIVWRNVSHAVWYASQPQPEPPTSSPQDWHVVSLQTRITKTNDARSLCSWKLVVRNDSSRPAIFHGSIVFQDAQGTKLSADNVNVNGVTLVAGSSEGVFTGSQVISSNKKVARAVPNISGGG